MNRRMFLLSVPCAFAMSTAASAEENGWADLRPSDIVLFRHANAPGVGDPAGFVIGDCSTQRNLDERGRAQARGIGAEFRKRGIAVGRVLSSQWCRARDTADLTFPGQVKEEPAFNSFFGDRSTEPEQTEAARRILTAWKGPGVLVVVTHQVNITALTGISPVSGEAIVLRVKDGELAVASRLTPPPL